MGDAASRERLAVTGIGIVTAAGRGVGPTLDALRSGGRPPSPATTITSPFAERFPVFEVADEEFVSTARRLPGGRARRGGRLAILAAADAVEQDARARPPVAPERTGVVVGTTVGGLAYAELWTESQLGGAPGRVAERPALRHLPLWEVAAEVARRVGARGPTITLTTACTGGAQAIAIAGDLLLSGACDVVVAGGMDVLARVTFHGFASLGLLDQQRCRPFDAGRGGLNLGEGAAFLVLRRDAHDTDVGYLDGWSSTADAHHMTAPPPDGAGLRRAIEQALARGGVAAHDVDWVHAHGTATPTNDGVECGAIVRALGRTDCAVSSTKHVFGHTLGAAGAVSAVVALIAIERGFVPGNGPIDVPDPECRCAIVPAPGVDRGVGRVLVNTMGFGGTNCVLLFSGAGREGRA